MLTLRRARALPPATIVVALSLSLAAATTTAPADAAASPLPQSSTSEARAQTFWQSFSVTKACPAGQEQYTFRAYSRWWTAPKNGYQKLLMQRQAIDDDNEVFVVNQKTLETKNTKYEGTRKQFNWTPFTVTPSEQLDNYWTRSVFKLQYKKDDRARDTVVKTVFVAKPWCVQPEVPQ